MRTAGQQPVVSARSVSKIYERGREQVRALKEISFEIRAGEFVAITGPSGAGKTTLLNLVGCMDIPSAGTLHLLGASLEELNDRERTRFRRDRLGFVFQHFGLLPTLTVEENVALPALFACRKAGGRVHDLLQKVSLLPRRKHRPCELSGGEMQRTAIARALVNNPELLLADEPTGNLDTETGDGILELFEQLNQEGLTIVVVTHNPRLAALAPRRIELADGKIRLDTGLGEPPSDSESAVPAAEPGILRLRSSSW